MPKPDKSPASDDNAIAQLGAAIDAKLATLAGQVDAVSARVDVQANAIEAVNKRIDAIPVVTPPVVVPPVILDPPLFDKWKADIQAAADIHCAGIVGTTDGVQGLGYCYYDAAWIWRNMAAYFNRPDYLPARDAAVKFYRDGYAMWLPTPGGVAGIEVFPHGLYWHYKDTGDERSKVALIAISQHAAFASMMEIAAWLSPLNSSREAAYALHAKLLARDLGGEVWAVEELKNICLGHLKMWRDILDGTNATPSSDPQNNLEDVRAFMVGLTSHALISYSSYTPDPVIYDAIKATLDLLWDKQFDVTTQSFCYDDRPIPGVGDRTPAPDLNMLIAPAYAWIGQRDRADVLFAGSVKGSWLAGVKQFNQSLRWTFDYLNYRK